MDGESVQHPDKVIAFLLRQPIKLEYQSKFKWPTGGGNTTLQSSPKPDQEESTSMDKLRQVWDIYGTSIYNPNPWVRILGRANDTEVGIDGKVSTALIDSGAMIVDDE